MKTFVIIIVAAIFTLTLSCDSEKNDEISEEAKTSDLSAGVTTLPHAKEDFPQEWKLIKMSGMMLNSETSGEDMQYQESYRFFPDKTFSKIRKRNNAADEASGTFNVIRTENGEEYYKLVFAEKNELIENCNGGKEEWLIIDGSETIRGTANACDYPTKIYNKV